MGDHQLRGMIRKLRPIPRIADDALAGGLGNNSRSFFPAS
jgi:hypothetical protein